MMTEEDRRMVSPHMLIFSLADIAGRIEEGSWVLVLSPDGTTYSFVDELSQDPPEGWQQYHLPYIYPGGRTEGEEDARLSLELDTWGDLWTHYQNVHRDQEILWQDLAHRRWGPEWGEYLRDRAEAQALEWVERLRTAHGLLVQWEYQDEELSDTLPV